MSSTTEPASRELEIDGVVVTLATIAFAAIGGILYLLLAYASGADAQPVVIASGILAAAIVLAWLAAYPRRATAAAVALVLLVAIIYLPRIFVMDGLLLREAAGMPASRLRVAIGLNIGGVFIGFLALVVFGFVIPLIASWIAAQRRVPGADGRLALHIRLMLGALIIVIFPFTSFYDDLSFALLRPARDEMVRAIHSGAAPSDAANARFPRIACCDNAIRVLDGGERILFPEAEPDPVARALLHERGKPDTARFRTIRDYGAGWRLVEIGRR